MTSQNIMKKFGALQLLAALYLIFLPWSKASVAYINYSNAPVCTSSTTISGTINLSFDSSSLSKYSLSKKNYSGKCLYLQGGYLAFNTTHYSSTHWKNMMQYSYGYCVTCNGLASCSSDTSCDNAVTTSMYASNRYQMTKKTNTNNNNYKQHQTKSPPYRNAEAINSMTMQLIRQENQSSYSMGIYSLIGAVVGISVWGGLLLGIKKYKERHTNKRAVDLTESLSYQIQVV